MSDSWEPRPPIPLDGPLERHEFSPTFTAVIGLFLAFVLFQIIISPLATLILMMAQGVSPERLMREMEAVFQEHTQTLLVANTVGQILGLALLAYILARLHSSRPAAFLRLRGGDGRLIVLSMVGLAALTPAVQWLGHVNESIPLPDFIRGFEQSQLELIERVLRIETGLLFNLVTLAITPAICEELLFRGYVQRQLERGAGLRTGIILSGVLFGLYHLRLSQALPLIVLGIYLAYLVWRTGSLWPAIAVHFFNNALAVAIGAYVSRRPEIEMADLEGFDVPWYAVAAGIVLFGFVVKGIQARAERLLGTASHHTNDHEGEPTR